MRLTLAFAACILCCATVAQAADLSRQSPLGETFAERPRVVIRGHEIVEPAADVPLIAFTPRTPGYYGRPGDYVYRNYYGTSPVTIFSRLPYACGFVALC